MSSQFRLLNNLSRGLVKPAILVAGTGPNQLRRYRRLIKYSGRIQPVPSHINIERIKIGDVPISGEWLQLKDLPESRQGKVILYLHGGGYLVCCPETHRAITWRLAAYSQSRVLAVDYRKSPEYPYPYPMEDALESYQYLLDQGIKAQDIVLAGDSAGGHLTLMTLAAIRDRKLPAPAGAVCLSPWVDFKGMAETPRSQYVSDPLLPSRKIHLAARFHANGMPLDDPRINLLNADLSNIPPVLIHAGSAEAFLSGAEKLDKKLKDDGVDVQFKVWPNAPHVFQFMAGFVAESNESLIEMSEFVRKVRGEYPPQSERLSETMPLPGKATTMVI